MEPNAFNYDEVATKDYGPGGTSLCVWRGCTNAAASNYDPQANEDDGTCSLVGCMNPLAEDMMYYRT